MGLFDSKKPPEPREPRPKGANKGVTRRGPYGSAVKGGKGGDEGMKKGK
jgi:hypothetical protein